MVLAVMNLISVDPDAEGKDSVDGEGANLTPIKEMASSDLAAEDGDGEVHFKMWLAPCLLVPALELAPPLVAAETAALPAM